MVAETQDTDSLVVERRTSIARRLTVMVMTIVFGVLLANFALFFIYDTYSGTLESIEREMELVHQAASKRAAPVMLFEDEGEALGVISDVSIKKSIILACLYTSQNKLLAEYIPNEQVEKEVAGKKVKHCPEKASLPVKGMTRKGFTEFSFHDDVTSPNGRAVASLYIVSDGRDVIAKSIRAVCGGVLFLLLALLLAYLLTRRVVSHVVGPIMDLAKAAEAVSKNDYAVRVNHTANDETGVLVGVFNKMMQEVQYNREALEKEVRERTRELSFSIETLEQGNKDKEIWIANMSHEIRTPVHGVLQFSEFGIKDIEKSSKEGISLDVKSVDFYFQRINQAAKRLCSLIEGILDFGKLNSGKEKMHYAECNMVELAEIVKDELRYRWEKKGVQVFIKAPQEKIHAFCDEVRITQVLTNLLGNAIKFSPDDETVELLISVLLDGSVSVAVRDHGMGIPAGEEKSIFEMFTQSTKTYDGSGGTGLGLSIVREIIRLHEGDVYAENNEEGEAGATFRFVIPSCPAW